MKNWDSIVEEICKKYSFVWYDEESQELRCFGESESNLIANEIEALTNHEVVAMTSKYDEPGDKCFGQWAIYID